MCLIVFAYKIHPQYPLILLSNRDEDYARPSKAAHEWPNTQGIFAGKDLLHGGTWLGTNSKGHWSAVTRYRDPRININNPRSQGLLSKEFLDNTHSAKDYLQQVHNSREQYMPFNLLVADNRELLYYSNYHPHHKKLTPGIYGLSNAHLDTPWPKVIKAKQALRQAITQENLNQQNLLAILKDTSLPADDQLPQTGIGLTQERALAPIFVQLENYGTRTSTILLINKENKGLHFEENVVCNFPNKKL